MLGELLVARGIAEHFGRGELRGHFVVARFDLVEFFKKRQICHVGRSQMRDS